jgi:hypothetical protein
VLITREQSPCGTLYAASCRLHVSDLHAGDCATPSALELQGTVVELYKFLPELEAASNPLAADRSVNPYLNSAKGECLPAMPRNDQSDGDADPVAGALPIRCPMQLQHGSSWAHFLNVLAREDAPEPSLNEAGAHVEPDYSRVADRLPD